MKNMIRLSCFLLLFGVSLSGCYYDKANELYPTTSCGDTTHVTYASSIAPIMVSYCNTCHSSANPSGNVITNTYDGLSVQAKNGMLWFAVSWEGPPQKQMPQGATDTLSICDRTKIKKWIDAGSPNN